MTHNEYWRQQYAANRYLSHLDIDQLSERIKYLIENLTTLAENGKVGMRNISEEPWNGIMERFAHAQTELDIRGILANKNFLASSTIPNPKTDLAKRLKIVNEIANLKQPELIKFGNKEYLSKYSFKISLASSFQDPSLNLSQMDNEMKAIFNPHPSEIQISNTRGEPIEGIKSFEIIIETKRDYYIFCTSHTFDIRLFDNFDADACLFIYDSKKFTKDLKALVNTKVDIDDFGCQPVEYLDPIKSNRTEKEPIIEFHKHIKYLYQHEYRHVFIPRTDKALQKDLFVSLNTASEYSELICL